MQTTHCIGIDGSSGPERHLRAIRRTRARLAAAAIAGALALMSTSASAQAQTPPVVAGTEAQPTLLPDVPLLGRNGAAVPGAAAYPVSGRWLLIVVRPGCAPCDALLARIQGDAWAPVIPRLVIITSGAGANAAEANRLATTFPALDAAAWYTDEGARLAAMLQLQESPVVLALHDRGIQWTLAGVLSGSKRMENVLAAWVKTPADRRTSKPLPPVAER